MTINEIKAILPDVKIKVNGVIKTGQLTGSYEAFPRIYTDRGRITAEFSWESIQRAINNNSYLIA